jgi:hypothetical protein
MAEKLDSSGGDWTAGIVAIVAALLLGGGIPVALYFGLYKPKVQEREAAEVRFQQLENDKELLLARQERVRGLEEDADDMAGRIEKLETRFVKPDSTDTADLDLKIVRATLTELAEKHNLTLLRERQQQKKAVMVYPANTRVVFENGLAATGIIVEAQATYHDFGRFLAEVESLDGPEIEAINRAVVIPESLICKGDANRGIRHVFILTLYVVEQRNVDEIGQ